MFCFYIVKHSIIVGTHKGYQLFDTHMYTLGPWEKCSLPPKLLSLTPLLMLASLKYTELSADLFGDPGLWGIQV